MTTRLVLQAPPEGAQSPATPSVGATAPAAQTDLNRVSPEIGGSINSVRGEIDDACRDMNTFHNQPPDDVMRLCGGHSARLSELRIRIQRIEDFHRAWKSVRTREIEPCLAELTNQYQIASRLLSARELDYRMETGTR